jgi:glycosyltransferase involved in cell wall biosynthesis
MDKYISIIIPAYNESSRISRALTPTIEFLKKQAYESEIIVVNDGSKDNTTEIANSYLPLFKNIKVIEYSPNHGKGYAVKKGMMEAEGKYRLFMDADYAVPIEYLEMFLDEIKENDIVIGSRGVPGSVIEEHQNFIRESLAKMFGNLQHFVLNLPIKDTQCGFKLFTNEAANTLFNLITLECSYFDAELLYIAYRKNMKIKQIPVKWKHDQETRLPIGMGRSIDLVKKLFQIRSRHKDK